MADMANKILAYIYLGILHVSALMGWFLMYQYYYEPMRLCAQAFKHLMLPFGVK